MPTTALDCTFAIKTTFFPDTTLTTDVQHPPPPLLCVPFPSARKVLIRRLGRTEVFDINQFNTQSSGISDNFNKR